ncbi:MAG: S8 family serine peptidase, partial [Bryobacteraceae bacterium]
MPKRSAAKARRTTGQVKRSAMRPTAIPGRYVMVLADAPVLAQYHTPEEAATPEGKAYRAQIETRQQAMLQTLQARNIRVTSRVSNVLNALFVVAPGHSIEELRSIPGVSSVTPMRRFKAKLDRAVQLVNGPAAWTALGGSTNAGAGVKIGILDSGLELTNPMFQDSSLSMPAGFPKCKPTASEYPAGWPYDSSSTADCAFTNSKVIVARSYVRLLAVGSSPNYAADSEPDDYTPRDRLGHGTAVASVAAGNAVAAPAQSSTGGAITLRGMAPKAWIGNYKVGNTFGLVTDETMIAAVEDAVADGMDVITTSVGFTALGPASSDPVATAFENAVVEGGKVGLAAAGNDGEDSYEDGFNYPAFNTILSPSIAPDVISVGATINSHAMMPAVSVNASGAPSNLQHIQAMMSDSLFYPSSYGANVAPLVDVDLL